MTKISRDSWREMFFGKRFRRWAFYFLLVFLAIMTTNDVVQLVTQYAENPKEANMNIVFNESITFPSMTFCMSKDQAWSHFPLANVSLDSDSEWDEVVEKGLQNMTDKETFLGSLWDYRMVVRAYQVIATVNSLERESTPKSARRDIQAFAHGKKFGKFRRLVKDWLNIIKERNITFPEFQQKVGLETIRRSLRSFARLSYGDGNEQLRAHVKITWISLLYICFQPTLGNETFATIEEQGEFFLMTVLHNVQNLEEKRALSEKTNTDECMTLDLHGRATTLTRNMEGKGRVRDGITDELCIGRVHEVRVDVRAAYLMLPNDEKPTACRSYDEGDESEFDCRSRCRMEMLQQMCLCTGLTLQYLADEDDLSNFPPCDYEKCGIRSQANYTDHLCADKCLPDCTQMRYNIQVDQKGLARPGLTMVTLIWGSFEYLKLEQQYIWNWTTFIAALGGSIGMWLGLSALSLIQFLTYLAGRVTRKVKRKLTVVAPADGGNNDGTFAANPFGGPAATFPFDSPFSDDKAATENSAAKSKPSVALPS